jgi:hypothetical protein
MISIFARPCYIGNRYPRHTDQSSALRLSSRIRGEEVANYLGAKLNPRDGFENDVCIHVKPMSLNKVKDGDYVDFLDGGRIFELLDDRPGVKVIAASQASLEALRWNLKNEIVLIPQHHLNKDRLRRNRNEIKVAGYIGSPSPIAFKLYEDIRQALAPIGFDFKTCFNFQTTQDAIDLYMSVDLFIIGPYVGDDSPHKIPTKLINAASFGVPTIAYPLSGYMEIEGKYVKAKTIPEIVFEAQKFKDETYYANWSKSVADFSEQYHISNIAKLYQSLV